MGEGGGRGEWGGRLMVDWSNSKRTYDRGFLTWDFTVVMKLQ